MRDEYRMIVRRGYNEQLKSDTLLEGELGFSVDTQELVVGTKDGFKVVSEVKQAYGILCTEIDGRLIPLCIRSKSK